MNKRSYELIWFILTVIITSLIHYQVLGPILFDDNVVQDDFRQSFFWLWQYSDPGLLQKSFYKEMYVSNTVRTPIFQLLFMIYPFFTQNLIFYSKLITLITAIVSSISAYLFFRKLSGESYLGFIFASFISVVFWSTDHISAVGQRAFLYFGLFLFMYLNLIGKRYLASLFTLMLLFLSPIAFLICFTMQVIDLFFQNFQFLRHPISFLKNLIKSKSFILISINALVVIFTYLVLFRDLPTQGVGKQLTLAEMKLTPEFNPGGRHPIFGSSIWDGTWWTNEHWGLGIGYLKISEILIGAFLLLVFFVLTELLSKKSILKSNIREFIYSEPIKLFLASILLFIASQILFPLLYMPSRFIGLSSLILSSVLIVLLLNYYISGIIRNLLASYKDQKILSAFKICLLIMFVFCFWNNYKNFYHPRYVSINPQVKQAIELTPKDAVIAGHPLIPDLNSAEILCKRAVFADYERSMAYTQKTLDEIRLRNIVTLKMVYAKNKQEFINLAQANGITHFLAHYYFYTPQYLSNPVYMKPYDEVLKELCKKNDNEKFYLQELLENKQSQYELIDIVQLN
jgi:hypothetical protein